MEEGHLQPGPPIHANDFCQFPHKHTPTDKNRDNQRYVHTDNHKHTHKRELNQTRHPERVLGSLSVLIEPTLESVWLISFQLGLPFLHSKSTHKGSWTPESHDHSGQYPEKIPLASQVQFISWRENGISFSCQTVNIFGKVYPGSTDSQCFVTLQGGTR